MMGVMKTDDGLTMKRNIAGLRNESVVARVGVGGTFPEMSLIMRARVKNASGEYI